MGSNLNRPGISAASLIEEVREWAALREDIRGLALVGSHVRGQASADSDIDLVVVCSEPARYLRDTGWTSVFGDVTSLSFEDWGKVQSVRVFYSHGLEVEFGIAGTNWIVISPDRGTAVVLKNGISILLDRDGSLHRMAQVVQESG